MAGLPESDAAPTQVGDSRPSDGRSWANRMIEDIIDAGRPIIDAHHHLWDWPDSRYLLEDILSDTASGHNIVGTVYVQCRAMYRANGPKKMRVIGETEFANGVAAMSASGRYGSTRVNAAILTHADLLLGSHVEPILEAHMRVGGERFRGVRYILAWDPDERLRVANYNVLPSVAADARFRAGFACLGKLGLRFEAFLFHPQLPELIDLARAYPNVGIILNHVGTPLRIGPYAGREDSVFDDWSRSIRSLAACPNVTVKLGGLSLHWVGFPFDANRSQPSSEELASAWRPFIETCIEAFGTRRCMFESNFPPDRAGTNYPTLWNAFKKISAAASEDEKDQLFLSTAARVYDIDVTTLDLRAKAAASRSLATNSPDGPGHDS